MNDFFISKSDFRIWLPDVEFDFEKADKDEGHDSRKIIGTMNTSTKDRQAENVMAKGLDFNPFLQHGHFNDNHDQSTSAVVGYPERVYYSDQIQTKKGVTEGWLTEGWIVKGTKRADGIWELAKALAKTPDRRLGFSIEGKVLRRSNKVIEKALIKNVAITNCPVNTDCTWDVFKKSFYSEEMAIKSLSAGYATSPATQSGGGALRTEDLDQEDDKKPGRKGKGLKIILRSMGLDPDNIQKAYDWVKESRPDFTDEAAAEVVRWIISSKGE